MFDDKVLFKLLINHSYFQLQNQVLATNMTLTLVGALGDNRLKLVRRKLKAGAKVNTDEDCIPPLHFAAFRENLRAMRLLLEFGADVCYKDNYQDTALHYAAKDRVQYYKIYKLLLENGASRTINDRNEEGVTPLLYVLACGNMNIVRLFLNYGADITAITNNGWTALHYAARNNHVDVLQFVLKQGLDIEYCDETGFSPLHHAAVCGNPEACELLLSYGAMVKSSSETDFPPMIHMLEVAADVVYSRFDSIRFFESRARVAQILLEHGAQMTDKSGDETVLEIAARVDVDQCIRDALMQHIAKMRYLDLKVDEYDWQTIESRDCYNKEYYGSCLLELENMKETKFYHDVSILDIFTKSQKQLLGYARNEELVSGLKKMKDYNGKFPVYFVSLKRSERRFFAEVKKQRLRKIDAAILSSILNLNDYIVQKIFSFLNDDDFKFFKI